MQCHNNIWIKIFRTCKKINREKLKLYSEAKLLMLSGWSVALIMTEQTIKGTTKCKDYCYLHEQCLYK